MIQVNNLTKDYGATRALGGVSFSVDRGEILGLLGPNGAGKTTTMRIVTGYLPPTSGSVLVNEMDVAANPLQTKRLIGYLPEFAPLYADMVVFDYLRYVAAVRRLAPRQRNARVGAALELCGLRDVVHQPFRELSRGYKQRVGLAHALLGDPDVLILDEPTAGLDPNQIVEIRSIIREAGRAKTVIFSTHILSEAESTCDRIVIIDRGRVVADGTADALKERTLSGMVVRLALLDAELAEVQQHLGVAAGVTRVARVADARPPVAGALVVEVACTRENLREIYAAVKQRDWVLVELDSVGQSLEDTFRELTRAGGGAPGVAGGNAPAAGREAAQATGPAAAQAAGSDATAGAVQAEQPEPRKPPEPAAGPAAGARPGETAS